MNISPSAGKLPTEALIVNVAKLVTAYYTKQVDYHNAQQQVSFGTSGHRGSSFETSFNEMHVLAISQAICQYRLKQGIDGPLFIGIDTHALSEPAFTSVMEVFAANHVEVMVALDEYTPTPAISHAILVYNVERLFGLADGVVITSSHNPPDSGGIKYNPPNGGPADTQTTAWIETAANEFIKNGLKGVQRISFQKALKASSTHQYDFLNSYVNDLKNVIDMDAIRGEGVRMGVDPLGGAGVHYWYAIADRYRLDLTVINSTVDSTFRFMSVDWDGKIRMDPSSIYAMQTVIDVKKDFDIAFACDADHDRHGIVTRHAGLMPANHYLSVAIDYLFQHRPEWQQQVAIGKTIVSSQMIDRVSARLKRKLVEVPVGFKWFASGLYEAELGFAGEESAGASFLRRNGSVWTTDKDGLVCALLSAEILARVGSDPEHIYRDLTQELGTPSAERVESKATPAQKQTLAHLSLHDVQSTSLAGEPILAVLTHAPGNHAAIGGIKVQTKEAWFAARPSGTEDIYKIYAESFLGEDHLHQVLAEAKIIVDKALAQHDVS